ncbi:hypothetical protein EKK58_05240 [Candidatus Dependentiae bacterium]|nr:MAG: hypothetical protein EKK58_05240 [Candidatus Dependentiae bacterium]
MSILEDLRTANTHPTTCDCATCERVLKLVGEVRGVLRSDAPPPKLEEHELRRSSKSMNSADLGNLLGGLAERDAYKSRQARGLLEPVGGVRGNGSVSVYE